MNAALGRVASDTPGVTIEPVPVRATDVPSRLAGFRTLFSAFHHFRPADAKAILAAAVRDRVGIAVAEGTTRSPGGLAAMALVPVVVWVLTPTVRPFRWSRLFWTYIVPVVPAAILFDGVVSSLRTYTPDELLALGREADGGGSYEWEVGLHSPPGSWLGFPYLIGVPRAAPVAAHPTTSPS